MPKNYKGGYTSKVCRIDGCKGPHFGRDLCHKHYFRMRRTGDPLTKVNPRRQVLGKRAEAKVRALLESFGRSVEPSPHYKADFDLLVDGKRIDVKCSTFHKISGRSKYVTFGWLINITHWGKVDESGKDAYIFRLERAPHMEEAVHLFFPVPISRPTIHIRPAQLLGQYSGAIADFFVFAKGQTPAKEVAA